MIYGLEEVIANLDRAERELLKAAARGIELASLKVESHVKVEFNRERTGKGFTDRTGTLRRSIGSAVVVVSKDYIIGVVFAGTDYAVYVECRWNGKYAYLLPGLMEMKSEVWAILVRTLKELFR